MIRRRRHIRSLATALMLSATYPALALPSFQGDWESGLVTGSGSANWIGIQAVASDRFTLVNDGVRQGTYARVEVRSGDNPLPCCNNTERAEVYGMQNADNSQIFENLSSGTQRYSFSVKFDKSWTPISAPHSDPWGIFLQLHGNSPIPPALAFSATDQIRFNMFVGDTNSATIAKNELSNGALNAGHWIDFILTTKFTTDNSGFVNIKRRDEGESSFQEVLNLSNTPTLQFDSTAGEDAVKDHYWKSGLYRNSQNFTSVLYLDGMTREAVPPVPEPEAYAMMLIGLGFIGFSECRRRNKY